MHLLTVKLLNFSFLHFFAFKYNLVYKFFCAKILHIIFYLVIRKCIKWLLMLVFDTLDL